MDASRAPGRFVLTGSQQFGLLAGVTQSLAGRVGMTQLLPLSLDELPALPDSPDLVIGAGGYPALHAQGIPAADWFPSYVATYVERDVRQLLGVQDLSTFQRFLRLCAGRSGRMLNLSALAGETGIAHSTARAWLSILEASYVVLLLPPYHRNFGKRLVKTPKLYFVDTGLACWLLGIRSAAQLALHPLRGALFETLVVGEFFKARCHAGQPDLPPYAVPMIWQEVRLQDQRIPSVVGCVASAACCLCNAANLAAGIRRQLLCGPARSDIRLHHLRTAGYRSSSFAREKMPSRCIT